MLMLALAVSDRLIDSAADLHTCSVITLLGSSTLCSQCAFNQSQLIIWFTVSVSLSPTNDTTCVC